MADVTLKPLPPEEAIRFFRAKGLTAAFAWQDVWQEEHARTFTVAKAMQIDILQDIRAALDDAMANGTTFERFSKDLRPTLEAKGWWGRKNMLDPLDGKIKSVQLGSPRRLGIIFDTNMRSAYAAGRWERIARTKDALPYLRYVAVGGKQGDGRTRPQHRAWHGTILPVEHVWWETHTGPCGWRCRCSVQQLNLRTIQRRGWTVSDDPIPNPMKTYTNPRSGEVTRIEEGIDPGFAFNPGKSYLAGVTPRPLPSGTGTSTAAERDTPAEVIAAFLRVFDLKAGEEQMFVDAGGWPVPIGPALFRNAAGRVVVPLDDAAIAQRIADTIRQPSEIRWAWRKGAAGRALLMRRYIAQAGDDGRSAVVDIGTAGWTFGMVNSADLSAIRIGEIAWTE